MTLLKKRKPVPALPPPPPRNDTSRTMREARATFLDKHGVAIYAGKEGMERLAKRVGMQPGSLHNIELGSCHPSLGTAELLSFILNCHLDCFDVHRNRNPARGPYKYPPKKGVRGRL